MYIIFIWLLIILGLCAGVYRFSSGMCTASICSASTHCTIHPCLSLTRAVSTFRKVLGIRLHSTELMVWTSSRGGHWGTGFLCSLLKMADEMGMAFCTRGVIKTPIRERHTVQSSSWTLIWPYEAMRMCSPWFWPVQTGRDLSLWAAQTQQERVLCWAPPGRQ